MRGWWRAWGGTALLLIALAAWWLFFRPPERIEDWVAVDAGFALCSGPGERQEGCVVDGDTVVLGYGAARRRVRLTGFDAPELDGACAAERDAARAARDGLHAWLSRGAFEWSGADDPPRDRYGRELRRARRTRADGTHDELAETMIASGLASASGWGAQVRDWCAR